LLQEQEGAPMISVDLGPGEYTGGVAVVLRGEFEVAGAASAAAVAPAGAACRDEVIAGLAGLEFISCSGLRVLQRVRMFPPGGRADGWVSHPHRCDMISAGSSVLTRGRYAAASRALAPRLRTWARAAVQHAGCLGCRRMGRVSCGGCAAARDWPSRAGCCRSVRDVSAGLAGRP